MRLAVCVGLALVAADAPAIGQQSAGVVGRVEIGLPITTRRPTTPYPTRGVPSPKLAPESERRHVVVYLRGAKPQKVAPTRVSIVQRGETFIPRVVAVPVGSEVE